MRLVCSSSHPRFCKCAHRRPGCPLKPVHFGTESLENKNGQRRAFGKQVSAWPGNKRKGAARAKDAAHPREPAWRRLRGGLLHKGCKVCKTERMVTPPPCVFAHVYNFLDSYRNDGEQWERPLGRGRDRFLILCPSLLRNCLLQHTEVVFNNCSERDWDPFHLLPPLPGMRDWKQAVVSQAK